MIDARALSTWLDENRGVFHEAKGRRLERERVLAPRLNIFHTLGIARRELHHSSFLADLLDPAGSHGQGNLFLLGFIDLLRSAGRTDVNHGPGDRWYVTTEEPCEEGRLDIVLRSSGTLIVIENKIDALEGDRQLERYRKWLCRQKAAVKVLVYLTVDGSSASSSVLGDADYVKISYRSHILPWLDELARDVSRVEAPAVRMLLSQYVAVLRDLTGGVAQMDTDKGIADLLMEPQNLEVALQIAPAVQEVKQELNSRFWNLLRSKIAAHPNGSAGWSIQYTNFEQDGGPYLAGYHSAAYRLGNEPPFYIAAQANPKHGMIYGIARPDRGKPLSETCQAVIDLEQAVANDLDRSHGYWFASRTLRQFHLEDPAFLCEFTRGQEPVLAIIDDLARKLAELMTEENRRLLIAACNEVASQP